LKTKAFYNLANLLRL